MNYKEYLKYLALNKENNIIKESLNDLFKSNYIINENLSLNTLIKNFNGVYPNTNTYPSCALKKTINYNKNTVLFEGTSTSEKDQSIKYNIYVKLTRNDITKPYSTADIAHVFCSCRGFRFNVAYPDLKNDAFQGIPKSNNQIPNKVRNKKQIPSICKHLRSFIILLIDHKLINES